MTGKSSPARRDKSGKNKNLSVATPAKSIMFAQKEEILSTRHEILMENHESLKQDYASLEVRFKHVQEMNEMMKPHLQNQTMELEATNLRLLKDLESEKDKYKKMVEEMKRMENELRIKNEELLTAKEKAETELKKMEDKYNELAERFGAVEKECSYLKSLSDAKNLIGQGRNNVAYDNEVIVVDEYRNVNNTVTDAIVISDESDAEYDNPPRESNIIPQFPVKQEEQCSNGANSSQVNHSSSSKVYHPSSSSSSSSSSSDEYVLVPLPVNRSRDDYNKS